MFGKPMWATDQVRPCFNKIASVFMGSVLSIYSPSTSCPCLCILMSQQSLLDTQTGAWPSPPALGVTCAICLFNISIKSHRSDKNSYPLYLREQRLKDVNVKDSDMRAHMRYIRAVTESRGRWKTEGLITNTPQRSLSIALAGQQCINLFLCLREKEKYTQISRETSSIKQNRYWTLK